MKKKLQYLNCIRFSNVILLTENWKQLETLQEIWTEIENSLEAQMNKF